MNRIEGVEVRAWYPRYEQLREGCTHAVEDRQYIGHEKDSDAYICKRCGIRMEIKTP
jgi:hypothetical protein